MAKTPTDIRSLARKHTALALRVLKEVASSPKAQQSARVAAAVALLDRGWGKPKQELALEHRLAAEDMTDFELAELARDALRRGNGVAAKANGSQEPDSVH